MKFFHIIKVVKIRIKSLLLIIVVLALFMNTAYAAGSKLLISDLDVKVGGRTSFNLAEGDTISQAAKPGEHLEFRVDARNNFTFNDNLDIKDVTIKVTIEGIDDGSDLEQESNVFNLRPNSDKRVTLKFDVPIEVEETTFNVVVHANGEDENGTTHEAQTRVRLEVNKDGHQLAITKDILSNSEISCNRKDIRLSATIINIGNQDEEDATLEIVNPNLGLDIKDDIGRLLAQPNEDSSIFSKVYTFNVPANAESGDYPITLRATFDNGRKKTEDSVTLIVKDCVAKQETAKPKEAPKSPVGNVEVITPPVAPQPQIPPETTVTEEGFFKGNAFVIGVIITEIIAVIGGIALIVTLYARRS